MKILLIEDDLLLTKQYLRVLKGDGYEVMATQHAIGAIDCIDANHPDVIVLDMLLSGSTAMSLLHELQSYDDLSRIPIIVVTNLADSLSLETLKPYGVIKLLDKTTMLPDDISAIIRAINL